MCVHMHVLHVYIYIFIWLLYFFHRIVFSYPLDVFCSFSQILYKCPSVGGSACRCTTANFMTTSYSQQPIWREKAGFAQMFPVTLIKVWFEGSERIQMSPLGLSGSLESFWTHKQIITPRNLIKDAPESTGKFLSRWPQWETSLRKESNCNDHVITNEQRNLQLTLYMEVIKIGGPDKLYSSDSVTAVFLGTHGAICTATLLWTAVAGLLIKSLCTPTQVLLITLIRPQQVQGVEPCSELHHYISTTPRTHWKPDR